MTNEVSQIARLCERAVVTAYRDLRAHGTDDMPAFRACTALYRIHHPEASLNEARRLVAEWIDHPVPVRSPKSRAFVSASGCANDQLRPIL